MEVLQLPTQNLRLQPPRGAVVFNGKTKEPEIIEESSSPLKTVKHELHFRLLEKILLPHTVVRIKQIVLNPSVTQSHLENF